MATDPAYPFLRQKEGVDLSDDRVYRTSISVDPETLLTKFDEPQVVHLDQEISAAKDSVGLDAALLAVASGKLDPSRLADDGKGSGVSVPADRELLRDEVVSSQSAAKASAKSISLDLSKIDPNDIEGSIKAQIISAQEAANAKEDSK